MYHSRPGVLLTPVSLTQSFRRCLVRNLVLFAPVFLWVLGQGLLSVLVPALHPGGWYFVSVS